jgi:hypothetical protein
MGTVAEHVTKANDNAAFAKGLELTTQANVEWATAAFFYGGLHYVDALLEKKSLPLHMHDTHGKRNTMLQMESDLKPIYNEYMDLYNFRRNARYYCKAITAKQVMDDVVPAFETVKSHIGGKL